MKRSSPSWSSSARWQSVWTVVMSCVTSTIVRPRRRRSRKTSMHFCANAASPTASTSSISMMSASDWTITAKAKRTSIPDE